MTARAAKEKSMKEMPQKIKDVRGVVLAVLAGPTAHVDLIAGVALMRIAKDADAIREDVIAITIARVGLNANAVQSLCLMEYVAVMMGANVAPLASVNLDVYAVLNIKKKYVPSNIIIKPQIKVVNVAQNVGADHSVGVDPNVDAVK